MEILTKISQINKEKEKQIQSNIFSCIEQRQSMIFNSGAGSGKTYALIESLKYIMTKYGENLKKHNQKIICITYTNVATREVLNRLGNTDLVLVSTIHERVWELIKNYQKQLVQIHREKLKEEIKNLEHSLEKYNRYKELSEEQRKLLKEIMLNQENRDLFYKHLNASAKDFKEVFEEKLSNFDNILKNIKDFRDLIKKIYRIDDYCKCTENIDEERANYKDVKYTSLYNSDRLHKMQISHDTLLEYGRKIIEKFNGLKRIIIDRYPFIFIDEYQDTHPNIVSIMKELDNYSKKINRPFFVGYFGDTAQNIYETGIGKHIYHYHEGLKPVNKTFNRRSSKEVIDVINKIRNDEIEQKSIFEDCEGGSVKFYYGNEENIEKFINNYKEKWIDSSKKDDHLHCLVLTNQLVAKYNGFEQLYNSFYKSEYYQKNYNQLNDELMSHDLTKLGEVQKILFNFLELMTSVTDNKTPVSEVFEPYDLVHLSLKELKILVKLLQQNKKEKLGECIQSILKLYSSKKNNHFNILIEKVFGIEDLTFNKFKDYLKSKLFNYDQNDEENNDEILKKTVEGIQRILDVSMNEYEVWYKYIARKYDKMNDKKIIYHTYHSTKGLEYDKVIIIMRNEFGRGKGKISFNEIFMNYKNQETSDIYEKAKNLLYVACSRARIQLRIYYIDDVTNFKEGIEEIFGKIEQYK